MNPDNLSKDLGTLPQAKPGDFTAHSANFTDIRRKSDFPCCNYSALGSYSTRFARSAGICGSSSGVEHNLAKVGVVGSNPISRSSCPKFKRPGFTGPFCCLKPTSSYNSKSGLKASVTPWLQISGRQIFASQCFNISSQFLGITAVA